MAQKVSTLAIDIAVTGAPQASQQIKGVEASGAGAAQSLGAMAAKGTAAVAALTALAVAARKVVDAGEVYTRIAARMAVVTDSTAQAKEVTDALYRSAQETGVEFEALAKTYARIALSAGDLGATQSQMVQLTQNVAKALQVSGASADEAASSAMQLAQALGSGKLAGDELKSILENAPVLAKSIAQGLGVSVGQLKAMGAEGKLTSRDVFGAILKQSEDINEQFGKIGDNVEKAGARLSNAFTRALAAIDSKIGASRGLSNLFNGVAGVIDNMIGAPTGGASAPVSSTLRATPNGLNLASEEAYLAAMKKPTGQGRGRGTGTGRGSTRTASTVDLPSRMRNTGGLFSPGVSSPYGGSPLSEMLATQAEQMMASFQPILDMAQGFGLTLADSLANGITAGVQSGSIGAGFRELGRTLIGGLGAQIRDFGIKSLMASQLMQGLMTSLANFLPGGGIAASVAMIALGSSMVGLAGRGARASFGRTNTGIDRGGVSSQTFTERGSLSLPSSVFASAQPSSFSGQVAGSISPVMVNATIIGPNDPAAQRQIQTLIRNAALRGAA